MQGGRSYSASTFSSSSDDDIDYPHQERIPNENNEFWARMQNEDPTNEIMYQVPMSGDTMEKTHSEDIIE
jgi:hypothetical protein